MFKRFASLAVPWAAVAVLVPFSAVRVTADPEFVVQAQQGGLCELPGANPNGDLVFGGLGQVVVVRENDQEVTLIGIGEGITNQSGRTQWFRNFACGVFLPSGGFVVTTDTQATVSASGEGLLTCTYTKP
jgi:hypothetical protein